MNDSANPLPKGRGIAKSDFEKNGCELTHRTTIQIDHDVFVELLERACDLGFQHAGKLSVAPLITAISQLDSEALEDVLRPAGLMPKRKGEYTWRRLDQAGV